MWEVIRSYNNNRIRPAIQPILDEESGEIKHIDSDIADIFEKHYGVKQVNLEEN